MFAGKPVIGVVGGIGSGKSFVARLFGELGCLVVDSDRQVRDAYREASVRQALRDWWGPGVFRADGEVDRAAVAAKVFNNPDERRRLEALLHPMVDAARERAMQAAANDPRVPAFVWDTPLLFEAGLASRCDSVVFVDAPSEERLRRVRQTRGWDEAELLRREKAQWPLDKKLEISDHVIRNAPGPGPDNSDGQASGPADLREQVRVVLSRILERTTGTT